MMQTGGHFILSIIRHQRLSIKRNKDCFSTGGAGIWDGVQVPQLGLGTQIQSLERDSSESGRALLNDISHDAVVAALQAGYRHLDTAHGYYKE